MNYISSIDEVIIKTLDRFSLKQSKDYLKEKIKLLAIGGKLCISGTDFSELNRLYELKAISLEQINEILDGHQSFSTLVHRCSELESLGLSITKMRLNGIEYYIEATRNI